MVPSLTVAELLFLTLPMGAAAGADQPPAINPFGPHATEREDAIAGFAELSDGTLYVGKLYLTRDARLKIHDPTIQRQREVPLRVVRRIQCDVKKQWVQKQWRFKENASDEKVYTGRVYPAREYIHTITLVDGRRIRGPLSGIIYVRQAPKAQPMRLLMHKRQKGPIGSQLTSLVYLRVVELGDEAYQLGLRRQQQQRYRNTTGSGGENQ